MFVSLVFRCDGVPEMLMGTIISTNNDVGIKEK
jgi:hypothetical protein